MVMASKNYDIENVAAPIPCDKKQKCKKRHMDAPNPDPEQLRATHLQASNCESTWHSRLTLACEPEFLTPSRRGKACIDACHELHIGGCARVNETQHSLARGNLHTAHPGPLADRHFFEDHCV